MPFPQTWITYCAARVTALLNYAALNQVLQTTSFADTIEDFERHRARFFAGPAGALNIEYPIACTGTDVDSQDSDGSLRLNYVMKNGSETALKGSYLPEEERLWFDPDQGFVDLSPCGVRRVTMTATSGP